MMTPKERVMLHECDELYERSKYDDSMIVGSEIRSAIGEAVGEIRRLSEELTASRKAVSA